MYKSLIRPLLFRYDPERVHHFTFDTVKKLARVPGFSALSRKRYQVKHPALQREVFGLTFDNPVGMAAGFDKDAKAIREFSDFGFGFIEIGTVTPVPQQGNAQPRLFRLKQDGAIINRMGFNNEGVDAAVQRLKAATPHKLIIGGNIGKNKVTPNETAVDDYLICFEALFDHVDYFVVNVSSPNTPGLRELQDREPLTALLDELQRLNHKKPAPKPILLKIAPDLTDPQLDDIITIVADTRIAGVIATNTTLARVNLKEKSQSETGGLSGAPLTSRSTEVIRYLHDKSSGAFPIIGVGGIMCAQDALEKLDAGASLVQLYTGFIYEGPALVRDICKALIRRAKG